MRSTGFDRHSESTSRRLEGEILALGPRYDTGRASRNPRSRRVQGVGFRPFVWRLANELQLDGFVRNDAQGVAIEIEGESDALDSFIDRLTGEAPGAGAHRFG